MYRGYLHVGCLIPRVGTLYVRVGWWTPPIDGEARHFSMSAGTGWDYDDEIRETWIDLHVLQLHVDVHPDYR